MPGPVGCMPATDLDNTMEQAAFHHEAGRLRQAAVLYRRALKQQPEHPRALHALGVIGAKSGGSTRPCRCSAGRRRPTRPTPSSRKTWATSTSPGGTSSKPRGVSGNRSASTAGTPPPTRGSGRRWHASGGGRNRPRRTSGPYDRGACCPKPRPRSRSRGRRGSRICPRRGRPRHPRNPIRPWRPRTSKRRKGEKNGCPRRRSNRRARSNRRPNLRPIGRPRSNPPANRWPSSRSWAGRWPLRRIWSRRLMSRRVSSYRRCSPRRNRNRYPSTCRPSPKLKRHCPRLLLRSLRRLRSLRSRRRLPQGCVWRGSRPARRRGRGSIRSGSSRSISTMRSSPARTSTLPPRGVLNLPRPSCPPPKSFRSRRRRPSCRRPRCCRPRWARSRSLYRPPSCRRLTRRRRDRPLPS